VFADGGRNHTAALLACFLLGLALLTVSRPRGAKGFVTLSRRGVAKRTPAWLRRWRRLSRDYEHPPEVSEVMVKLAMIRLMVHRAVYQNRERLPAPQLLKRAFNMDTTASF